MKAIEPHLMSLLASRIGSIAIRMNNAMVKAARSSVLALCRDLSSAICDGNGDVLAFPAGFPAHVGGCTLAARSLLDLQGDNLRPGDAYLHNSPYHGNTHPADHTILVPVFHGGELMFISFCKGHQADVGNSIPTTYNAWAKDVYEEGALIFPCVRVQRDYRDVQDIIRICRMRIRVPDVWYGDYLAMLGAARIGERELTALIAKYGKETIKAFCQQYHEYGEQLMKERIRKLPRGTAHFETHYDPIPGVLPEGVKVKVNVEVNPEEGTITCDLTDNIESQPCGINLCEATVMAAARTGILNRLSIAMSEFPCCEGALRRIIVKMNEGSMVGKARHPFSSSVATNNLNDRVVAAVQCALNQITDYLACAEPHWEMGASIAVISGKDTRYGNKDYVTQIHSGISGGPGMNGHDGYLFYAISTGGMHIDNSKEMIERAYPILYIRQDMMIDGLGAGKWDGAPTIRTIVRTTTDPVTIVWVSDGHYHPARGAAGGQDGLPAQTFLVRVTNGTDTERLEELPTVYKITLQPGQGFDHIYSSSGGYGDPLEREPEMVRHRAREGWISLRAAQEVYGVVLDTEPERFAVDRKATEELRKILRSKKK